jgi:hypothetical protein
MKPASGVPLSVVLRSTGGTDQRWPDGRLGGGAGVDAEGAGLAGWAAAATGAVAAATGCASAVYVVV